jgi:multidrug efflux system membrane fusion protein
MTPDPSHSPTDVPTSNETHQRRKRWPVWLFVLLILCGGGYLIAQRVTSGQKKSGAPKRAGNSGQSGAISVAAAVATTGNLGVYLTAIGTVTPVYTVTVTSRVVGTLMAVHYKEGQLVKKGDLLAEIDPRPYEAALTQAQGQMARDEATLRNARIDLERYRQALEQHAIPEQTMATQQATVNQDEGAVKADQGILAAAQVNVDYTRIRSPIDGRVGLRTLDPGNIVQANGATSLAVVTQLQPITVIFPVAEDYISEVVKQMQAGHQLRVDALDRQQQTELAQGTLLTIDNQIDITTGTVRFRAIFPNKNSRLFPNEFVNAKLLVRTLKNATLIPSACIQRNGDTAYVYVVQADKTVKSKNIGIETTDENMAAVTGVAPGDMLVSDGFDKLQDGVKVVLRKPAVPTGQTATASQQSGNERQRSQK